MKSKQIVLGLDMDGVIIDHTENKIILAKRFGFDLRKEDTPSDRMRSFMPSDRYKEIQHLLYDDPAYALTAPLMQGALSGLEQLKLRSYPYFLISRRKLPNMAVKLLKAHRLWDNYFTESNTVFVATPEEKDMAARERGVTHYLDDEIKVLRVLKSVPHRLLFNPYNHAENGGFASIHSWEEFLTAIPVK